MLHSRCLDALLTVPPMCFECHKGAWQLRQVDTGRAQHVYQNMPCVYPTHQLLAGIRLAGSHRTADRVSIYPTSHALSCWGVTAREPTTFAGYDGRCAPWQGLGEGGNETGVALRRVPVSAASGTCAGMRWAVGAGSGGGSREL